jgi:hypothetical protein
MDIATLRAVFMWCTILTGAIYILTAIMCAFAGGWIYRIQSKWFPLPRETFNVVIYSYLGVFKIVFLVFVLIPYVALLIVG